MIFKAKNEWGNAGVTSGVSGIETWVNNFKKNFQPQQRFNEKDTQAINNYVTKLDELKTKTATMSGTFHQANLESMAWQSTMQDQSEEAQTFVHGLQNGTENLDNMTKASKAAELGMRGLALAGNMLASFLVSSFISLLINVANASDEIADSAAQIGNSFKETTSDLDDYKTKVDELRNTIDDSSSSIADVQNARKELMSIQDDLIEKYGTEESVVKSITDAVNGEANAWDQLKKKKWTESRNEFNNNFSNGTLKGVGKNISNFFNGYQNNIDRMKKEYGDYSVDINTGSITGDKNRKQAEDILSKFGILTKSANNSAIKQLTIKGNAEEVYNTLLNIQSVFNDINNDSIGKNSSFVTELGNMAEAADDVVQKYQDFWTEYVLNEEILSKGSKYTSDYKDIISDYNDYQKAVENGDKETVKATKQTLVESISDAMDTAEANGDDDIVSFFQDMYPDIKAEVASWRLEVKFDANTDGLKDEVKDPLKVLKGFSSDELKSDVFDPNKATKEQQDAYNTLISVADQYGLTIDDLIEKLQKMGLLSSDAEKLYDKTVKRFKAGSNSKKKNLDEAEQNLQNEYDKITGKNGQRNFQLGAYEKQIKNGTLQSKFGNVDMDKRTIIEWSNELKKTYKDELDSWDYDPEIGSIDTVRGGSERFGEDLNGTGWEIAFTTILPDGTFLSSDTVHKYINKILEKAYTNDGKVTEDELTKIDAEGIKVGNTFVHGIFAGIDDSEEYDNNGNWAEVVGRLMHFSGDSGAISLAKKGIEKAKKFFGQDDQSKIEKFLKSEGLTSKADIEYFNKVTSDATSAAEAIKMYNAAKKKKKEADQEDSTTQYSSFKQGWKDLDDPTDDTFKNTKYSSSIVQSIQFCVQSISAWQSQSYISNITLSMSNTTSTLVTYTNSYNTTRSSGYNVTSSRTSGYTAGTASRTSGYNTSRSSQYNVTASRTSGYTVGTASRSSGYNTTRSSQYDVTSSRTSGYTIGTASRSSDYSTTRSSGYTANTASRASEYNTSRSSQYNITSSRTSGYTVSTASRSSGYSTTRSSQYDVTATRSSGYVANTSSRTSGYNTTRSSSYNVTATRSSQYNLTSNYTVNETASTTHVTRTSYWTSNNFNM